MPGWNEKLPVFYIHWHSSTELRTPMLRWSFKRFLTTSYPVFITVSSVHYKQRGLKKNLGITYLTIVLTLYKILTTYIDWMKYLQSYQYD